MQEVIILRGIPGSGKSTFALAWVKAGENRVRINRDDIRKMCFDTFFGGNVDEKFVTEVEDAIFIQALMAKKSIVIDNTNIKPGYVTKFVKRAKFYDVNVSVKEFDVPVEVALERNAGRDRKVPDNVIRSMHASMQEVGSLA